MKSESSISIRVLAALITAVLLGGAITGAAVATASAGSAVTSSTTDSLETTTETLENATTDVTDDAENETATTETDTGPTTAGDNETTSAVNDTVTTATETVAETTTETTDAVDAAVGETAETIDATVNETTGAVNETVTGIDATAGGAIDGGNASVNGTIGVTVGGESESPRESRRSSAGRDGQDDRGSEANGTAAGGDDGRSRGDGFAPVDPPSTSEAATNAALIGMLGAITASGAAASGAGGAGTSGAAGGAGTATAGWLRHLRHADHLRPTGPGHLRRAATDLWKVLPIFRYSRYDDSDPLEHDRRRAIYETISERPGAYLSEVSDRAAIPLSTVRHHVRILEDEGLVTAHKVNGKRRYFLEDGDAELQAALAEPAKREVLETIADLGRARNGRLADELGRDPSTVSHHLAALEDAGLVVREKDGRATVNELPPRVEAALIDDAEPAVDSTPAPADD